MLEKIRQSHRDSHGVYGAPRIHAELRADGQKVSRKRIERLMRSDGLRGAMPRRRRIATTDSRHGQAVAENILDRAFDADRPNRKWVSDLTYIRTAEG